MASRLIKFLGSIRLAVPLLAAIAAILIVATFYESNVGSATVQREVYKSAWFGALMFLLAVNLGISTLSRYPWRGPRKIGFALTHWGLIVIIAGSAAVIHLSTEGMLLVRTDSGPNNQIRVEGDLLEVVTPEQTQQQTDIFIRPDGSIYPEKFAGLSLASYSDKAIKTVRFTDDGTVDNLAVKVQLQSDLMGQTLERWLAVAPVGYSQMDIGPAYLEIAQAQDDAELQQLLRAPDVAADIYGQLQVGDRRLDVQQSLGASVRLRDGLTVEVAKVWPDFRLNADNQPTSISQQFRNPAVQLNLTQGDISERWFVFAQPGFEPVRSGDALQLAVSYEAPQAVATDYFRIVAAPDHQLFYAAASSKGFKSGLFALDEPVTPGWADFKISLAERLDRARVQRQVVPVTPVADGTLANEGSPALQVASADGQDFWLPWGEPTSLATPNGEYFVAFSPKLLQLPFYVKLDDFIVERNEGSESVAMWTSRVTLFDPQTDTAAHRLVWMNHPTWFRGWKLAQASWNPGDLQQSTLQLKREPWWVTALTWSGSLMVVVGISIMFYGPGLMKKFRRFAKEDTIEAETPAEAKAAVIPILAVFGK
ncbi:MAG: cytochrome c biogenesis protein ResB [Cyanobacteria bacterium J06626_18]